MIFILFLIGGGGAGYYYWRRKKRMEAEVDPFAHEVLAPGGHDVEHAISAVSDDNG